jgi:predicted nucleotidyltransferase
VSPGGPKLIFVPEASEQRARAVLDSAGARFGYLFGSRATGSARPTSDADMAVMPGSSLGLLEREQLAGRLATAFGATDVDLVLLDEAGLELRGKVVQEGRLIHSADEPARVAFEVRTRSEFLDFEPTLRAHERRLIRQVADRGL